MAVIRDPDNPYWTGYGQTNPAALTTPTPSPSSAATTTPGASWQEVQAALPQVAAVTDRLMKNPFFSLVLSGPLPIYRPSQEGEEPDYVDPVTGGSYTLIGWTVLGDQGQRRYVALREGEELPESYRSTFAEEGREVLTVAVPEKKFQSSLHPSSDTFRYSQTRDLILDLAERKTTEDLAPEQRPPSPPGYLPPSRPDVVRPPQYQWNPHYLPTYHLGNLVYDEVLGGYVDPTSPDYQAWREWGKEMGFYDTIGTQGQQRFRSYLKELNRQAMRDFKENPQLWQKDYQDPLDWALQNPDKVRPPSWWDSFDLNQFAKSPYIPL